jgi:DNA-binding NtrC family response regulator
LVRFRLVVLSGPDAGREFLSSSGKTVIGTHDSADLVLTDPTVSRFHAAIFLLPGRPRVRDLESKNGTIVDGTPVVEAHLRDGAILQLCDTKLRFEVGLDRTEVAISPKAQYGGLVGASPAMRLVFAELDRAARSDATVLLEGETGTGKGAAAEAVHVASARAAGPFMVVDCGAIPPTLIESELFGNERGAFTGATASRAGAFEAASGGTLFLDEIGELGLDVQPKLLRALEERSVKRVGSNRYVPVDVRIIAATNRNLRAAVNKGSFRADLYYRLAVLVIRMPPLRERLEDLSLLIEALLDGFDEAPAEQRARLRSEDFQRELLLHPWPGNVRELRNYLERCLVLETQAPLVVDSAQGVFDLKRPWRIVKAALERHYLEQVLRANGGNISAAARAAGLPRFQLYRLLARHGLR